MTEEVTIIYNAQVKFDYEAVESTELSIKVGDIVGVEESNETGWCLVVMGDREGWVPTDFIERIEDEPAPPPVAAAPAPAPAPAPLAIEPEPSQEPAPAQVAPGTPINKRASTAKICAQCNLPITAALVVAKDKNFHPECFQCITCQKSLGGQVFIEKEGKFYCEICYYNAFNPKCGQCDKVIMGQYVSALDRSWHAECFVCSECCQPFTSTQFHKHNNKPYCEQHFRELVAETCDKCHKPIEGQIFEALDKKFHLDCFVCKHGCVIGEGINFHVHEDEVYCLSHFEKLFMQTCESCKETINGQYIKVLDKHFHPTCWKCTSCQDVIQGSNCAQYEGQFYCRPCVATKKAGGGAGASKPAAAAAAATPAAAAAAPAPAPAKVAAAAQAAVAAAPAAAAPAAEEAPAEDAFEVFYSYDDLKSANGTWKADGKNSSNKEMYLSDGDFQSIFSISRDKFQKLPNWKKKQKKQAVGLW